MATLKLDVAPIGVPSSFQLLTYRAIKQAIASLNIYGRGPEIRLDGRQLSQDLRVSRTPIRAAIAQLEQEGLVRTSSRRGVYVVRKTKNEIVEMIQVWAALEGLSARLVTERASDDEIATLRRLFDQFQDTTPEAHLDAYSDANIEFHQAIIRMGGNPVIGEMTENLIFHVRAVRRATIGQDHRGARSIVDHMSIIEALTRRDAALAERLACRHTLDLAMHVERHCDFLG